ncbi:MAG: hypothetical protein MJ244_01935 [Clostridia bacterium]|nr:hypothetical protein [Clostridia bacterium]
MRVKIKSRKEITKELRKMNQEKLNKECPEGRYCHICGTDKEVQNHHIIKVEDLSKTAYYHKVQDLNDLYIPTVDLCDYHHKVWHGCTGDTNYIDEDIDLDAFYRIVDILGRVDLSVVPDELYSDYKEYYDHMVSSFVFELKERYAFSDDEVEEIEDILLCSQDLYLSDASTLIDDSEFEQSDDTDLDI